MKGGNAAVELAEARVEAERAAGIARIQAVIRQAIDVTVSPFCNCGERIPDARRQAMPKATRCFDCETFTERQSRRRA
ncbi:MAG: TraR/DksA family transcriptional regulator [Mesorhizobium sp.]|uniref:TraR/DksA C4-type zinc finger protein n=1 Tax=Mesorhizobium sp. TaxID=1871066 RepID=UPI000FE9711B|nr:TraR/DksA C4-type zinc finger protein [Mesorhizobium sp.]RWN30139.1 MAG: TraR/DksA family transcriptional regulator [Mesorhizobium sp.]